MLPTIVNRQPLEIPAMLRIVFSPILGGWFIVCGPHHTPIGGRFESRAAALAHLNSRKG
jgi:hypothetical protein